MITCSLDVHSMGRGLCALEVQPAGLWLPLEQPPAPRHPAGSSPLAAFRSGPQCFFRPPPPDLTPHPTPEAPSLLYFFSRVFTAT